MKSANVVAVASVAGVFAISASAVSPLEPMLGTMPGYEAKTLFTVGESIGDYTPPGVLDGLGAYEKDKDTIRVLANHELLHFRGYDYEVQGTKGLTFMLDGARISYFDIDKDTAEIKKAGLAYKRIYDANGNIATSKDFQPSFLNGFSRFCSSQLVEAKSFPKNRGFNNRIYLTGEEDGGLFNPVGGAMWALDTEENAIWHVPALGRGGWENVTLLDTGDKDTIAILLADDSSPFDFDNDGVEEAAPLFLYVGTKAKRGDFLEKNGLRGGKLYVWVSDTGELTPAQFNTAGSLLGSWVEVDNSPNLAMASEDGSTGYDEYGYPTQGNLWLQAEVLGAFGFSRPEDVATNPQMGNVAVLASTGVDTFENGVDTFGTMYLVDVDFDGMKAVLSIIYDGDADVANRALRSPDNLDWADDGFIYVQEDKAETDTLDGEFLFGPTAVNTNEAGIVRLNPLSGSIERIANVDRSVVLDASIPDPTNAVDKDAGTVGEWETSGIIDISSLLGHPGGSIFLLDVQAHGIEDQDGFNAGSRINDNDLVEGGQLVVLYKVEE